MMLWLIRVAWYQVGWVLGWCWVFDNGGDAIGGFITVLCIKGVAGVIPWEG